MRPKSKPSHGRSATTNAWWRKQLQKRRSLYLGGSLLILTPNLVYCDERAPVVQNDVAIIDATKDNGSPETMMPDKAPGQDYGAADTPTGKPDMPLPDGLPCKHSTPGSPCTTTSECPPDLVCYAPMCVVPCPPSCAQLPCDPSKPNYCHPYNATCTLHCGKYQCTH